MRWIILSAGQEDQEVNTAPVRAALQLAQIIAKAGRYQRRVIPCISHADVPMLTLNQSKTTLEEIFLELTQGQAIE